MPYYTLNITFREPVDEMAAHDMLQELGIEICQDISYAIDVDHDTFEAMVFGTTVLGPNQGTVKMQMSRPLELPLVASCIGALSAEPQVGAAFWSEEGGAPTQLPL